MVGYSANCYGTSQRYNRWESFFAKKETETDSRYCNYTKSVRRKEKPKVRSRKVIDPQIQVALVQPYQIEYLPYLMHSFTRVKPIPVYLIPPRLDCHRRFESL